MRHRTVPAIAFAITTVFACAEPKATAPDQPIGQVPGPLAAVELSLDLCAFGQDFSLDLNHAYLPFNVGNEWVFEGEEDEAAIELTITVLKKTQKVGGVLTRVVKEVELEDGDLKEESLNYFAASADGTVCYFGEEVDIYEDGKIVSHAGAWRADDPGNAPGIFMPADPRPGTSFQMEVAPGIAQDLGTIVGSGPVVVTFGFFADALRVRELNPLDGDVGIKFYGRGVGLLVDGPVELVRFTPGT